jgi:hypothetical protein
LDFVHGWLMSDTPSLAGLCLLPVRPCRTTTATGRFSPTTPPQPCEHWQYEIAVKIASDYKGMVDDVNAEYDDASAIATETDVPIREAMRRAENNARNSWVPPPENISIYKLKCRV